MLQKHMIAVTSETSPLAKSDDYLAAFFMDDYIGGRFLPLPQSAEPFIPGIRTGSICMVLEVRSLEDKLSANEDVLKNPEMLDALIGIYERNVLGYPCCSIAIFRH